MSAPDAARVGPAARRLAVRLAPHRLAVAAVLFLGVAGVVLNVVGPALLGAATDVVVAGMPSGGRAGHVDVARLGRVLLLVLGTYLGSSVFAWLQGRLMNDVVAKVVSGLRRDVEDTINRMPLEHVDRRPRGEILGCVTNDVDNVATTLQQTMSQLLTSLLTVVGVLVMMLVLSPVLALVGLLSVPLSLWLTRVVGRRAQRSFADQWHHTGTLNGLVEEAFTGHDVVRAFGRTDEFGRRFAATNADVFRATRNGQFVSGALMPLMMLVGNLDVVLVAVLGGLRVVSGTMTIGEVQAFVHYARQFTQPLTTAASMTAVLQSGAASAQRVFALLDAPAQSPDPERPQTRPERRGRVAFENVHFRYRADTPLIEDLTLVAEPGQTVAVVGPTGAGKTTLVNLVLRFYDVDAGRITLDGVDTTAMTRAELRSGVGMVLQDTWLFAGTIRENIAYGDPSASDERVLAAAGAASVDRFVRTLPDGYDTRVGDDESTISAGERQLVTIARAFLADPSLLILDEATSSVDTRTELLVQRAMADLRRDRTSFVVAHRLSTIRDADLIVVMESGRIVEQGGHDELIRAGGTYRGMYEAQPA